MKKVWYKGALHTHSFGSDGEGFPEEVVVRHCERGYDFVTISDHNVVNRDKNLWLPVLTPAQGPFQGNLPYVGGCSYSEALRNYENCCPGEPHTKRNHSYQYVRVKTIAEVQKRYDQPGKFLVLSGEEISHWFEDEGGRRQLHCNVINLKNVIPAENQADIPSTLQRNCELASAAFAEANLPGVFICNHPHGYIYDLEPQYLIDHPDIRHFELVNSNVDGVGGEKSLSNKLPRDNEMFFDMVNCHRVRNHQGVLYAAASDDAHRYDDERINLRVGVGFSYVMVKIKGRFTRRAIAEAMNDGNYYPSTGVHFKDIIYDRPGRTLKVEIQSEKGVNYHIEFIVTKKDAVIVDKEIDYDNPERKIKRRIALPGQGIGVVAKTVAGLTGEYTLADDDLFVRAVAISDRLALCRSNRMCRTFEAAWTQILY